MTIPGGRVLPTSAVTAVTTTATHRRRGLASRMMAAELAAAKERGEALSVLIAAEFGIYGRFGYGPATEHQTWTLDAQGGRLRTRPQGTVEHVDRETARAEAPAVYARHRAARPGEIGRTDRFWDIDFGVLHYPSWPEPKPAFHVLARDPDGAVVGMARYTYEEKWEHRLPQGSVQASMFLTTGPLGDALLLHHLLSLDMVTVVHLDNRPPDDIVPWLLLDARHARPVDRSDFLWLRPLDVPAMLSARSYPVPVKVVIEVVDGAGLAGGVFAVDGGPDGAACEPTGADADLTLDAAALGSIYLGGHGVRTLAAAGLIDEHSVGAVERADTAFRSPVTPWCNTWF
jgi:predicted acetyltransferase